MPIRSSDVSKTALLCLLLGSWMSACERDKAPAAQGPAAQPPSPTSTTQHLAARLPNDWPKQVPVYPGATILPGLGLKTGMLQRTSDDPAKVVDFYKAQLSTLHLVSSVDEGAAQSLTWSDDAQPPLRVKLRVGTGAGDNTTMAYLRVFHTAIDDAAQAPAATGQAGATAKPR